MSWLAFQIAKFRGDEQGLQRYSTPVAPLLKGKSVALIGNARSLSQGDFGSEIDTADLVIRINGAPLPSNRSHGSRTDWLAMSTPTARELIAQRNPSRILWMTRKRKRLPYWLASDVRFFLNPLEDVRKLRAQLASPPTTGLMVIDLLLRSDAQNISLYGFDFFASLSLSGRRDATQVPHDFGSEKKWVLDKMTQDPRLELQQV